jgi:hypothetical protein
MPFKIREIDAERNFSQAITVDALDHTLPQSAIHHALALHGLAPQKDRKLTLLLTTYLVIALHLYPTVSTAGVLRKLVRGARFIWSDPSIPLPGESALAYRRAQLGARPLVTLFKHTCQPIATPQTRGAFLFGLRLMGIDGTKEDLPDTEANLAFFGRPSSPRGTSAFPQAQGVYLVELGTHAVVDAGFWPCHTSERVGGFRLLRSVHRGMLVMWDRGFHDFDMLLAVRQRKAHVLGRLPAHVKVQVLRALPDGSTLAYLLPAEEARRKRGERLLVRVISYTITDVALPGFGETHRVITTLLNPRVAPAHEVACGYHERWEVEVVIDEIDTHQRLVGRTLRSLRPVGVVQELYGVLLAHYAVRYLMHEAALRVDEDVDRLSFVHALEVGRDAVPEFQMVAEEQREVLYERMLMDIAAKRLPPRRTRSNARVVKRKMSKFLVKRAEHARPPKPTGTFRDAVKVEPPAVLELPPPKKGAQEVMALELPQREILII